MQKTKILQLCLTIFLPLLSAYSINSNPPHLTVIIEIDQFAHHYIPHIEKYVSGGIKFMLDNGVRYSNAYWPHAMPATAVGHVAINTGTYARYHGIIGNSFQVSPGKLEPFDTTSPKDAAVFGPTKPYHYGKSAHKIKVDGVSDQLVLASREDEPITVYAISYKSRAAIGNAGKLAKAIWFDEKTGKFTSSKAYFQKLPNWLKKFNQSIPDSTKSNKKWKPFFPLSHPAYAYADIKDVSPFQRSMSVIGETVEQLISKGKTQHEGFTRTPQANQMLFDLAKNIILKHPTNKNERLVLWLSLSPLDKLCHFYGPQSKEVLDMIYHLDEQLKNFFEFINKRITKKSEILYVLTADHGVDPLPEYLQKKGLTSARRVNSNHICKQISNIIMQKTGINIQCTIKMPQLYFDETFSKLNKQHKKSILKLAQKYLEKVPGVRKVWTYEKLYNSCIHKGTIESYYQNQLFPGRSGSLIFQVEPFVQFTKYPAGTSHRTPYEWNTHVPLIFYRKDSLEKKIINKRVSMLQVANSLAQIHDVPKPSASTFNVLPLIP